MMEIPTKDIINFKEFNFLLDKLTSYEDDGYDVNIKIKIENGLDSYILIYWYNTNSLEDYYYTRSKIPLSILNNKNSISIIYDMDIYNYETDKYISFSKDFSKEIKDKFTILNNSGISLILKSKNTIFI